MSSRYFGCHVSVSGGLENGIKNGEALGVNTIQIHPSPPQRWNSSPFKPGVEDAFIAARKDSVVKKVFFHAIYLINLATPDKKNFHLSKTSLVHSLDLAHRIKGEGVIFHVGSLKDHEDEDTGLKQAASGVNWILEHAENESRLLLEVAAGGGKVIGARMEQLARIYELVDKKDRVGFALDTQHLWASGYNLQTELDKTVSDVKRLFGFERVWAVHLNDSKTECASRRDRHENLGDGLIGKDALMSFFNHKELKKIPFILETPAMKSLEEAKVEAEKLRGWVE